MFRGVDRLTILGVKQFSSPPSLSSLSPPSPVPLPSAKRSRQIQLLSGSGSTVSSPTWVRGRTSAEKGIVGTWYIQSSQNASGICRSFSAKQNKSN